MSHVRERLGCCHRMSPSLPLCQRKKFSTVRRWGGRSHRQRPVTACSSCRRAARTVGRPADGRSARCVPGPGAVRRRGERCGPASGHCRALAERGRSKSAGRKPTWGRVASRAPPRGRQRGRRARHGGGAAGPGPQRTGSAETFRAPAAPGCWTSEAVRAARTRRAGGRLVAIRPGRQAPPSGRPSWARPAPGPCRRPRCPAWIAGPGSWPRALPASNAPRWSSPRARDAAVPARR